jgi:probable selenium-dependent hydroxylase accessory protein YqeC
MHTNRLEHPESFESLSRCLGLGPERGVIAIVGAGGKTSLMYRLARELVECKGRVITTSSTKIFPPSPTDSPCVILLEDFRDPELFRKKLNANGHITVGTRVRKEDGKLIGIDEETICSLNTVADFVIVEADGAKGRSVKAPEAWEPVIPRIASVVVVVVGLDCLGKPANESRVFRLDRFCEICGIRRGQTITPEMIGLLLRHPLGGIKLAPRTARVCVFLNKLDTLLDREALKVISNTAMKPSEHSIDRIAAGSLRGCSCEKTARFVIISQRTGS